MTRLILCVLAALAIGDICQADVIKLPVDVQTALRDASRFHEIHAATDLPREVSEPGQKWEATDVISDDKLPTKRLIWAFTDGDIFVVHYERGGRGHSFHVLVARLKAPKLVWYGTGIGSRFKDYSAFLDALKAEKLKEGSDFAH